MVVEEFTEIQEVQGNQEEVVVLVVAAEVVMVQVPLEGTEIPHQYRHHKEILVERVTLPQHMVVEEVEDRDLVDPMPHLVLEVLVEMEQYLQSLVHQ